MELCDEQESIGKCYKFEQTLFDNLNITYNASNSLVVLWNKFQIFAYDDINFENISKIIVPDFQVHQLLVTNNYILCLDNTGNLHTTSLKFKNLVQKRLRSCFQLRLQGVMVCFRIQESLLSLTHVSKSYFLCTNKISSDFLLENKILLKYCGRWPLPEPDINKCILTSYELPKEDLLIIKNILGVDTHPECSYFTVISFDKIAIYGCLYSPKAVQDEIILVKLYTCPSEISNVNIIKQDYLFVLIGLKIGTLIRLPMRSVTDKPDVIHLNTSLHKYLSTQNSIIYTDGKSLWKSDNVFKTSITFSQFFVKNIKDMIKAGDQLICTSYTKLLYVVPIDYEGSYVKPKTEEYCPAEKVLNNSEYFYKIIEEVEKNNELTRKLSYEGSYITALSLSNRQDIMENVIHQSVMVYENYDDVIKENFDVFLTEHTYEYFKPKSFFILVNLMVTSLPHLFNNILSNVFNEVKIHITFFANYKTFKTTSIKITKNFKKIHVLLPFEMNDENISEVNINTRLVSSIPGALDAKQKLWVTLYKKNVVLNSEHFIRPPSKNTACFSLTEPIEPPSVEIYKTAMIQFAHLIDIRDLTSFTCQDEFSMYTRLPDNYKIKIRDELKSNCLDSLNKKKATYILQCLKSEDFLNSYNEISFACGNIQVKILILKDDFTYPTLKVTSKNMATTFHIRNFISNIIHNDYTTMSPCKEYVKYSLYTIVQDLQKEIKNCLEKHYDNEEFQLFAQQFERNVIGVLPI